MFFSLCPSERVRMSWPLVSKMSKQNHYVISDIPPSLPFDTMEWDEEQITIRFINAFLSVAIHFRKVLNWPQSCLPLCRFASPCFYMPHKTGALFLLLEEADRQPEKQRHISQKTPGKSIPMYKPKGTEPHQKCFVKWITQQVLE